MPELDGSPWVVITPERYRIKQSVEAQGIPLEDWDLKIYRGVLTGFNKAFYLTQKQRDELIAKEPQAKEIIVPLLRGRYVGRYKTNWDHTWMIGTFKQNRDHFCLDNYPEIKKHLLQYRIQLEPCPKNWDRKTDGTWMGRNTLPLDYLWYEVFFTPNPEKFYKPKIIYQDIAINMLFFFDEEKHFFFNNTCWMMTGEAKALPYLTAIFNSSLFRFCFRDNFPEYSGKACRMFAVFFKKIPIKKPDTTTATLFATLVDYVQFVKADINQSTSNDTSAIATFLEELIDACVMEVYFADHMAERNLTVIAEVNQAIQSFLENASDSDKWQQVQSFYDTVNAPQHQIRDRLTRLPIDSPDLLRVIKEEGKV